MAETLNEPGHAGPWFRAVKCNQAHFGMHYSITGEGTVGRLKNTDETQEERTRG